MDVAPGVDVIIAVAVVIVLCARKLLRVGELAWEAQHRMGRIGDHRARRIGGEDGRAMVVGGVPVWPTAVASGI